MNIYIIYLYYIILYNIFILLYNMCDSALVPGDDLSVTCDTSFAALLARPTARDVWPVREGWFLYMHAYAH